MAKLDALTKINLRSTPQTVQADPRQVPNHGGGYSFVLDDEAQLRRFLILGTTGGSYYASEEKSTLEAADVVLRLASTKPKLLVDVVVEISVAGRAPKVDQALFALAVAAASKAMIPTSAGGQIAASSYALSKLPQVARTGTHLFQFVKYVEQFRGWGPALTKGVAAWYLEQSVEKTAYQMVKYRSRHGWSHGDVLRKAHPTTHEPARNALFRWSLGKTPDSDDLNVLPSVVVRSSIAMLGTSGRKEWLDAVQAGVPWEGLPDVALKDKEVWEALLSKGMPTGALIRQLPRLTNLGLLTPGSSTLRTVAAQLQNQELLQKARIHPVNVLVAQRTYASGVSVRGKSTWSPTSQVVDALDAAFYLSFKTVEPTGKRTMIALDASASMTWHPIAGLPLYPREASAAMSMATAAAEDEWGAYTFSGDMAPIDISPRRRLDDNVRAIQAVHAGPTDCALPMTYALRHGLLIDVFQIYTDNETNWGNIHPHQALAQYREKTGIAAKLVVFAMNYAKHSIADPTDAGMLDIVGFDSAAPQIAADFARGL